MSDALPVQEPMGGLLWLWICVGCLPALIVHRYRRFYRQSGGRPATERPASPRMIEETERKKIA